MRMLFFLYWPLARERSPGSERLNLQAVDLPPALSGGRNCERCPDSERGRNPLSGYSKFAPTWAEHEALQQDLDHAFQRIVALEKKVNEMIRFGGASMNVTPLPRVEGK